MQNKQNIRRSCVDCAVAACESKKQAPPFCEVANSKDGTLHDEMLGLYKDEEMQLAKHALETAHEMAHSKLSRAQATTDFIKRMGYKKIGIATCVSFQKEARIYAEVLRDEGFEVYGVSCKAGSLKSGEFNCSQNLNQDAISCNPIYQAKKLAEYGTELNIVIGLCVGHDSLFISHSKAPCTVLATKDRQTNTTFREEIQSLVE